MLGHCDAREGGNGRKGELISLLFTFSTVSLQRSNFLHETL